MIRKRPIALEAVAEQALYIAESSVAQAERFLDAVESTLNLLHESPEIGRRYETLNPRLAELRTFHVNGFPNHVLFYRVMDGDIVFVHLVHAARDIPSGLREEFGI